MDSKKVSVGFTSELQQFPCVTARGRRSAARKVVARPAFPPLVLLGAWLPPLCVAPRWPQTPDEELCPC